MNIHTTQAPPAAIASGLIGYPFDALATDLDVVFVGTAAADGAERIGPYYAEAGNLFWPTLHQTELAPRRIRPQDLGRLRDLGIGFADIAAASSIHGSDVEALRSNLRRHQPRAVALTGKGAARIWLRRRSQSIRYGLQPRHAGDFCSVFVLPSPASAARRYWNIAPWRELSDWIRMTGRWRY